MADKEKRLRKILDKKEMRGKLKSVDTIEKASIVIVETLADKNLIFDKNGFKYMLSNGETFSEDRVHFLVSTNPRDRRLVEQSILSKTNKIKDRYKPRSK